MTPLRLPEKEGSHFSWIKTIKKLKFIEVILKISKERLRVSPGFILGLNYTKNSEQSHAGLCSTVHPFIPVSDTS